MHDFWKRFILPPDDERLFTTSSHDVTGFNDDGFGGTYSYLYHDSGDPASPVIFEAAGPGMVRLIRTGGLNDGELLVYLNGSASPTHRWPFDDLYAGKIALTVPGHTCREKPGHGSAWAFLELAYDSGCKLVAHNVSGQHKFFNIFATRGKDCRPAGGQPGPQPLATLAPTAINGYGRLVILDEKGSGVITSIALRVPDRPQINRALRDLRIRAYWEGEKQAAVDAPAGLFFGVGYTGQEDDFKPYELKGKSGSLFIPTGRCPPETPCFYEAEEGFYVFSMPMPFAESARLELVNTGDRGLEIETSVAVTRELPPEGFCHFYAIHRREDNLLSGRDHTVLSIRGSGYFLGGVYRMNSRCFDPAPKQVQRYFLEGDARFYIDDAKGFLNAATGTEEYFNWGWYDTVGDCWPGDDRPFAFPTHGYTEHVVDLEDHTTMYRLHTMDPVPFHRAVDFRLEHGPDGQEPADYESVAFCYLNPGKTARMTAPAKREETEAVHYRATRVWEGNDQVTASQMVGAGDNWLSVAGETCEVSVVKGETRLTLEIPEGSSRLVLRRQNDGAWTSLYRAGEPSDAKILCVQSAEVFLNGRAVGVWRLPPRHGRDCWMQDEFVASLDGLSGPLHVTIRNLGDAGWNACSYCGLFE